MASLSMTFIILNLIILWNKTHGLIGYYCGLPLRITAISLLDIQGCTSQGTPLISATYLQFLRVSQNNPSIHDCQFDRYNVLHEGIGKKFVDVNSTYPPIFAGIMENSTFALKSTGQQNVCGRTIYTTKYPELLILEAENIESSFATKRKIATDHMDIFAYLNKKFVYPNVILKNTNVQIQLLYHDVLLHECYIERENLKYTVSAFISRGISPDLFAYTLMKTRGYTAVARGEVAYIIKCTPIEVAIRKTKYCYNQLPVSYNNHNFFLTPITRIIIYNGTKINCSSEMPVKFFIDNKWYEVLPEPEIDEIMTIELMFFFITVISAFVYIIILIMIWPRWFPANIMRYTFPSI